jgi:hypothetical protein
MILAASLPHALLLTLLFVAYRESLGNSQVGLTPAQLFFGRLDHYNILCVFLCERIFLFFPCQNNVEVCMAYLVMSIDMKIRRIDSKHILDFECK